MPLLILGKLQVPKLPIMALNGKDFARLIRSLRSLVYKTIWQTDDVSFGSRLCKNTKQFILSFTR